MSVFVANLKNAVKGFCHNYREIETDKNFIGEKSVIVYSPDEKIKMYSVLSVRFYERGKSLHCSFWFYSHVSGFGKTSGSGYERKSAAFANALENSKIEIFESSGREASISGVGDKAIERAMIAIVETDERYKDLEKYIHTSVGS